MGQIMDFWFWQRLCRACPVLWLWNECKKIAGGGKWGYIGLQPGGKMEIPDHCNLRGAKAQGGNLFRACGSEAI
jgi:hypothetical protein